MSVIHLYADESRQTQSRFMLFGALAVPRGEPEDDLRADVDALRARRGLTAEMKWGKVSRGMLPVYQEFVDVFFAHPAAAFRCLVVDTHKIDYKASHSNDRELGFYTFYYHALARSLDPTHRYLIFTDERTNRSPNRLSDLRENINRHWQGRGMKGSIVRNIEPRVSKESDLLQIVDVLLGAVGYDAEEYDTSPARMSLVRHIAGRIGVSSLREYAGDGNRFSVWRFRFPEDVPDAQKPP